MTGADEMLPGERVLWQGRPCWRALARDVLHIRWVAAYVALALLWRMASDELGVVDALRSGAPSATLGVLVLGAVASLAWAWARTTTYTITTERCVMRFGIALEATLSIPWRRVATVSVRPASDGTGDIPLALKPGSPVRMLKLWPHVRFWRVPSHPMLRAVPGSAAVALLMSHAAAAVTPGQVHAGQVARRPARLAPAMAAGD